MADTNARTKISRGISKRIAIAVGHSLVSTVFVVLVAVGIFIFREGYVSAGTVWGVMKENDALFGAIFLGLAIWNFRIRQGPVLPDSGRNNCRFDDEMTRG